MKQKKLKADLLRVENALRGYCEDSIKSDRRECNALNA